MRRNYATRSHTTTRYVDSLYPIQERKTSFEIQFGHQRFMNKQLALPFDPDGLFRSSIPQCAQHFMIPFTAPQLLALANLLHQIVVTPSPAEKPLLKVTPIS